MTALRRPAAPAPRDAMEGPTRGGFAAFDRVAPSNENGSGLRVLLGTAGRGLHGRNSCVVSGAGSY